ncbi:MAG: response regulator transcription factor [Elusimicrobia bacterium]|nr:response regulator transcription factor [Elusimicrobiota bacterium]
MKYTILVVDDEPQVIKLLQCILEKENYNVIEATDGSTALFKAKKCSPDLIVLDIIMSGVNGYEVCRLLKNNRKTRTIPIIMVSGQSSEKQKIEGLNIGADDYIAKPFSSEELKARIKALLRRMNCGGNPEEIIKRGGVHMNITKHQVKIENKIVRFTPMEFDLLFHLMKSPGVVHKTRHILESVWGYNEYVNSKTLDVHISRLRKKLGKKFSKQINNIYNVGYVFAEDKH